MSDFLILLATAILRGRLPRVLFAAALCSGTLVCSQEIRSAATPITREEVWKAVTLELQQRGVREEQLLGIDEIDLPSMIPASASRIPAAIAGSSSTTRIRNDKCSIRRIRATCGQHVITTLWARAESALKARSSEIQRRP